jgi:hypothetical protein
MQRNDEAQAELVKYHAVCDELSSKLAEREGRDLAEMQQQQQQQQQDDGQRVADGMMDTSGGGEVVDGMAESENDGGS